LPSPRAHDPLPRLPDLAPLSPAPVKHRRHLRNYIIDKRLQLRYIGVVSLLSAAISTLLGWIIWNQRTQASRTIIRSLEVVDWLDPDQKVEIVHQLTGSDSSVLLRMGLVCAGLIVVLSLFLVVMTHRAAGPLHVIGGYFDQLAAGKLPLVHNLRRGDAFKVFHKKFKDMCNALRRRAEDDVAIARGFLAACAAARVDATGALGHALEELRQRTKEKDASLEG
jgi:hypothetical protein